MDQLLVLAEMFLRRDAMMIAFCGTSLKTLIMSIAIARRRPISLLIFFVLDGHIHIQQIVLLFLLPSRGHEVVGEQ